MSRTRLSSRATLRAEVTCVPDRATHYPRRTATAALVYQLRDCVIRLGLVGGALAPAVIGPDVVDEIPDGDDGVGQGDERLDHPGAYLGALDCWVFFGQC